MRYALRLGWRTLRSLSADHATSYAAAIAYYALFSVFPLILFLVSISGYFLTNQERNDFVATLSKEFAQTQAPAIYHQVQTATSGRATLGIIGLLTALWAASSVFTAIRTGLNVVWHKRSSRPWLVMKLFDLLGVFALGFMLALALAAAIFLTRLEAVAHQLLGTHLTSLRTFAFALAISLAPILIIFATFWLLYSAASPPQISKRHAAVGAVVVAVGFEVLSLGFSLYVRYFARFDAVYGSLGAIIAFMVYAFLIGLLILAGGELSEQYWQLQSGPRISPEQLRAAMRGETPVL